MESDYSEDSLPIAGTTPMSVTRRHQCVACFKQYKKKEHLIEHMKTSYHSVHQPKCGICQKYFRAFESLREHIHGPLSRSSCSRIFAEKGCSVCLKLFNSAETLADHNNYCQLPAPAPLGVVNTPFIPSQIDILASNTIDGGVDDKAVAVACETVGGGSNGSLDLCARVCLVDEDEKLLFHTYVLPQIHVTDYRFGVTGIKEEHLRDAMPLNQVQEQILQILYSGESMESIGRGSAHAKVLVGHNLDNHLDCLRLSYPDHLLRDTGKYHPLMKTNLVSHSLKYLVKTFLGYEIQNGVHDPYEDCVSVMRLYKRMRSQDHQNDTGWSSAMDDSFSSSGAYDSWKSNELDQMTPDELLKISRSNYRCWCLDSRRAWHVDDWNAFINATLATVWRN